MTHQERKIRKNQKSYCFKSKNNLQQVNKNLILVTFSRDENFKLKHLVKKTFEGIAFYKIESTSIEKTKIVTCSSDQIPNFESTNPEF